MPALVSDPVTDLVAAASKLRAEEGLITSPEMLLGDCEALLDVVTAVHAALVRRLRDAWHQDATRELCGRSTKRWLVEEQLLSGPDASRLMKLVHKLPERPLTASAYDAGEISTAHAVAILNALQTLPSDVRDAVEPHLVEQARECPPEDIAAFVDELLDRLGLDKASDARRERRYAQRGLNIGRGFDGHRSVVGNLTPEVGMLLEHALGLAAPPGGPEDERTLQQRQHDGLGTIASSYIDKHASGPSFTGSPRSAVIITMDLETLEDELRAKNVTLPDGGTISAATARRLACKAGLIPVVLGGKSEVVDIGQVDHDFTVAIRRAAYLRDGGRCAFPKCRNPLEELHHIHFRRHGGATSLENAASLCAFHHWLAHEGGWTLRRADHGGYLWIGPHGQRRERHLDTS